MGRNNDVICHDLHQHQQKQTMMLHSRYEQTVFFQKSLIGDTEYEIMIYNICFTLFHLLFICCLSLWFGNWRENMTALNRSFECQWSIMIKEKKWAVMNNVLKEWNLNKILQQGKIQRIFCLLTFPSKVKKQARTSSNSQTCHYFIPQTDEDRPIWMSSHKHNPVISRSTQAN